MAAKKVLTKCKFEEGEKVLCYEPDPAKTKVLYDSKVLKVVPEKDEQGRKFCKFLIHFQGWNSTWDRYVTDEFILKDTEENRKLQKELAEEAQLTPGGNLYRKERKKRVIKPEPKPLVIEPAIIAIDDKSMVEDENVPVPIDTILLPKRRLPDLEFPDNLKFHTGYNCYLVHEKNTLVQLPCQPNVVTLLESYLRYLARNNFSDNKATKKKRQPEVLDKRQLEKRYIICVEVLDGLRICFNTFLFRKLLVNEDEQAQYYEALKVTIQPPVNNTISQNCEQNHDNEPNDEELESHENKNNVKVKRENTRSSTSQYASSQQTCSDCSLTKSQCSKIVKDTFEKARDEYVSKADSWKAVPDSAYDEEIKQPAVVYGVYHLLRLLEKLPKILANTEVDGEKLSIVYSYSNGLLKYLSTQTHLFGMQYYVKNEMDNTIKSSAPIRNHRNHKNI
ncbi:PREDICTED: male-specific lethal 3 homolog [Diuraphis noxia]|uniref:male-specific lethal 3 homolog n=1 Tax=Diuraphis noxia TaxID=143948 RepID=UPI000763925F|nr:PREDICTED: male-specific lethal 3 homolog [Diuraphis noxia]